MEVSKVASFLLFLGVESAKNVIKKVLKKNRIFKVSFLIVSNYMF